MFTQSHAGRNLSTAKKLKGIPLGLVSFEEYPGIVIAPHLEAKAQRTSDSGIPLPVAESHWYYTWVVASGCIWDASVILNVRPTRLPAQP